MNLQNVSKRVDTDGSNLICNMLWQRKREALLNCSGDAEAARRDC